MWLGSTSALQRNALGILRLMFGDLSDELGSMTPLDLGQVAQPFYTSDAPHGALGAEKTAGLASEDHPPALDNDCGVHPRKRGGGAGI